MLVIYSAELKIGLQLSLFRYNTTQYTFCIATYEGDIVRTYIIFTIFSKTLNKRKHTHSWVRKRNEDNLCTDWQKVIYITFIMHIAHLIFFRTIIVCSVSGSRYPYFNISLLTRVIHLKTLEYVSKNAI